MDLLEPIGSNVNDRINRELCSLKYMSVDNAVQSILDLRPGSLIAKLDIESAYKIILIHLADRPLLGMSWKHQTYINTVLPFGLRSAPLISTAVTDAVKWILKAQGVKHVMHYLDDYLLRGPPDY